MTDVQKVNDPDFYTKQGTLITKSYKDAWKLYWDDASNNDKELFLNLPNFDSNIFLEITGIDTTVLKVEEKTCEGKIVEIEGKKYKLTEV